MSYTRGDADFYAILLATSLSVGMAIPALQSMHENMHPEIGFFKDGDSYFPYEVKNRNYYVMDTKEQILEKSLNGSKLYMLESEASYFNTYQIFPLEECNPNAFYNEEVLETFTNETYQNLEESYFLSHPFLSNEIEVYEILNLTTNQISYVIGKQLDEIHVFNFESYQVEDYMGYAIKSLEVNFDKKSYSYQELLEMIENFRKETVGMKLERK